MSRLIFTPVNLSVVVRDNPPTSVAGVTKIDRTIPLRQHTFSVARYLINELGHTVLQDRFGEIWSQKTGYMVVPIGARRITIKDSNSKVDLEWIHAIVDKVDDLSRHTIATSVPYAIAVLAIYEGCSPLTLLPALIPTYLTRKQLATLKPVNAWMAFRAWFADGLKTHYVMGQSDVSRLAKICYDIIPITDLANIATMYTHSRDNCTLGGLSLSEFVKRELEQYGYTNDPIDMLEDCGASFTAFEHGISTD